MNIIGNRPNQVQAYRQLQQASVTLGAAETESKGKGPIDSYVSDVSRNFRENGAVNVLFGAAIEGCVGGFIGQVGGSLLSGFFPGAVGAAVATYAGAVGATLGVASGLAH